MHPVEWLRNEIGGRMLQFWDWFCRTDDDA